MVPASQRYSELVGIGHQVMGMNRSQLETDEAGAFGLRTKNSNPL
jgi:hypothetical protein